MQGTTSFNDPLLPTAQEYSEYNRDDENLPEASTTDPSRILDSDEYEVYKNVPVFVEHTRTLKSGRELRFGRDELEALAQRSNRRIEETGDFAPVVIGHTNPDPAAPDPPKIGWAGPFRLGWLTKDHTKYAVLADFRIEKDKTKMLNKYPRRSAELWAEDRYEDMYLDPISLLGADTPWSDMGVLYCKQGDEHREKIYYSITPQVPGAYGFPKPVVIKNSSSSDSKDGKKEKYSMENEDYDRDPQNLSQDQKDVANTIVSAIFDSPEFKYLRKLMNQEADKIEEENDENAAKEQNNGGSALGNDDSEKISEKIEEISNSEGNTEGESNEYTDENNDVQNNEEASGSENGDETTSESGGGDDEEEKLDLNDKPEEDDGHDPYEAYYKRSGRQDNSMADEEEKKEETTTTDDADAEDTTTSSEENADSDDVDVDSMSDEEFENYLRKKYGVHDDEEDDSDDDEDEDKDEGEHANYAKEDDDETDDNDETDNKFMSMPVEEIKSYLETKYGGDIPKPGDPQFAKLSTDLAYLAYLIKSQEEPQVQEENIDDASSPQRYSRGANPDAQYAKEEDMTTREYCDRKDRESDDFDPQQLIETNVAESKARKALDSASDEDRPALKEELDKIQQYQKELRLKKKARDERFAEQYSRNGVGVAVNVLDPSYDGSLIWTLEATIGELEQLKEYVENKQWREAAKAKLGHALSQEEESAAWVERLNDLAKQGVWWATNPKLEYDPNEEDEFDGADGEEDEIEPAVAYEGEAEDAVEYQAKAKKSAKKDDDSEDSDAEKLEASLADLDVEEDEEAADDDLIDADEEDVESDDSLVDPDDDLEDDDEEEEESKEDEPAEYARKKKTTTSGSALKGFLDDEEEGEEEDSTDDSDATEVEQNCKGASETSVPYNGESVAIVESDGDVHSRDDLLNEIEQLKNRIASLEKAFDRTTEKVVSAERYSRLHDLRENFVFDENMERENCRYCKMSDEQFEKRCEEIQSNYRRVPTGIEVPFGLVSAAPADADRPGSVQYAKETSADIEKQVVELAESYAARGIYKPSDEIRAEVAANNQQ